MQLTKRVYLVGSGSNGFSMSAGADCNIYLIDGGDELALIDAGVGENTDLIINNIRSHGFDPNRIAILFLTHIHADHSGGAFELRERIPGLRVAVAKEAVLPLSRGDEAAISLDLAKKAGFYPQDYVFNSCPVDIGLMDGEQLPLGDLVIEAVSSPGHSAYDIAFLFRCGQESHLFSGDTIFHGGKILLQSIWDCDLQKLITSLRRLGHLDIDVLLPGHALVSLKDGFSQIQKAIDALDRCLIPKNLL